MPYLICMGSDVDNNIRLKADQQLQEIDKKYPGFIQVGDACLEPVNWLAALIDWLTLIDWLHMLAG